MRLQPRRDEMLKAYGGDHQARWEGEGAYGGFTWRSNLSLSKDDATGKLGVSFFLPPKSTFVLRDQSTAPTLLVETAQEMGATTRTPKWQAAGVFVFVGCLIFFATAFNWHRMKVQRRLTSRLARADAVIFAGTVLLSALILACLRPEADWNPKHLDFTVLSSVLVFATFGGAFVFWRVQASYVAGATTPKRAALEGFLAAGVLLLCLLAADPVVYLVRWGTLSFESSPELPDFIRVGCILMLIGAGIGITFWAINRSLIRQELVAEEFATPSPAPT
jgi:hypothetical protein